MHKLPPAGQIKATATAITEFFMQQKQQQQQSAKGKLITKLTLCQTRNNEPKARHTHGQDEEGVEGHWHTFL